MIVCSMPECQTTAGCKCAERQRPKSEESERAYRRGWDDCLLRVYQVLGEKFTLPSGLPGAADNRATNVSVLPVVRIER